VYLSRFSFVKSSTVPYSTGTLLYDYCDQSDTAKNTVLVLKCTTQVEFSTVVYCTVQYWSDKTHSVQYGTVLVLHISVRVVKTYHNG